MQRHSLFLRLIPAMLFTAWLATSCANPVKPTGGPRDQAGPSLDSARPFSPPNLGTFFDEKQITIHFDEYLRPGSYGEEIFISPVQRVPPAVMVRGKDLVIRFEDTLRRNTTYIVQVTRDIKDYNEGNKMEKGFVYAFTTGAKLDSCTFKGKVMDPYTGTGERDMTLLLYAARDITGDSIFEKRPVFASQTDSLGNFLFDFLPPGEYKLYGVKDADKSYSYNQAKERIALMQNPIVTLTGDSTGTDTVMLYSFLPDVEPPRVKSVKWLNPHSLIVEFREAIHPDLVASALNIAVSDTNGSNSQPVARTGFRLEENKICFIETGRPATDYVQLAFTGLRDTMGNTCDTTLLVRSWDGAKKKYTQFREPVVEPTSGKIFVKTEFPLRQPASDTMVVLLDSLNKPIPLKVTATPFQLVIEPLTAPRAGPLHALRIAAGFPLADSLRTDSALEFKLTFPNLENLGNMSGEIVPDSSEPGARWIVQLMRRKKGIEAVRRTQGETKFSFKNLEPGKYFIILIKDDDGNGVFTPGSLFPYRMPEKVVYDPRPLDVRARWDFDNYKVYTTEPPPTPGKSGKLK